MSDRGKLTGKATSEGAKGSYQLSQEDSDESELLFDEDGEVSNLMRDFVEHDGDRRCHAKTVVYRE